MTELKSIDNRIRDIKETDPAAEDITRIEFLKSINPRDKIVGAIREHRPDVLDLEVAIHINPNEERRLYIRRVCGSPGLYWRQGQY